jgi:hypothetical protein
VQDRECRGRHRESRAEGDQPLELMASRVRTSADSEGHPAVRGRIEHSGKKKAYRIRGLCSHTYVAKSEVEQ